MTTATILPVCTCSACRNLSADRAARLTSLAHIPCPHCGEVRIHPSGGACAMHNLWGMFGRTWCADGNF